LFGGTKKNLIFAAELLTIALLMRLRNIAQEQHNNAISPTSGKTVLVERAVGGTQLAITFGNNWQAQKNHLTYW
jgi:hypothetical protein